jgi:hypothetical protein
MSATLDKALQLSDQASRDPVLAVRNAEAIGALLRQAKAEGSSIASGDDRRLVEIASQLGHLVAEGSRTLAAIGCSHIIRLGEAVQLTTAQRESPPSLVSFPGGRGIVRSVFAGTVDGDPSNLSRVSVRININGTEELFSTGQAPAWTPLIAFQPQNHNWFRLGDRPVDGTQRWSVAFRYEGWNSGPPQISPFILFGYATRNPRNGHE